MNIKNPLALWFNALFTNMNYMLAALLPFIFIACVNDVSDSDSSCFPDKGIKVATTVAENGAQTIEYDRSGRPVVRRKVDGTIVRYEYQGDSLMTTITERKVKPDFYLADTDFSNAETTIDTGVVITHNEDGRPLEMGGIDSTSLFFEYDGCEIELQTLLKANGDTIQHYQLTNKDGVLIETKWTTYGSYAEIRTTEYINYEFNEKGHWIKRSYQHQGREIVTEKRELTYY